MLSGPVFHARFLSVLTFIGAFASFLTPNAKAPTQSPKHGLTGSYYVGNFEPESDVPAGPESIYWSQVWFSKNDFELPRAFTAPAATHVDPQVAFGQGKGFNVKDSNLPLMTWWPTSFAVPAGRDVQLVRFLAATWKGYIHLPKPGTYYFSTVSWFGPSAVYLNQARVALNGIGGVQVAHAFSYAKEDVQDFVEKLGFGRWDLAFGPNSRDQYVVPVSIDGPRDLPIEVQYQCSRGCFGIDLFWVTPDAPRDANGKPIAKIVPSDVLYTEPPSPIEKPTVRSANSTIEADHLYFPTEYVEEAVGLKIRLADKDGNPVAGKRVYVSSLTSYGNSDAITQPEKPTDKNGETTAKIRANATYAVGHDSAIFATDVTDFVDVAQVAHVTFQQVDWNFFDTFAPYWDQGFLLTPKPPVVGQPATIKTELKNHSKFRAKVTVTFLTTDVNIGFTNWNEIAKVKDLTLQPGESKQVSTTFTPKEVMGHKCYRVEVRGEYIASNASGGTVFTAAVMPLPIVDGAAATPNPQKQQVTEIAQQNIPGPLVTGPGGAPSQSMQINTETVAPGPDKNYWRGVYERSNYVNSVCDAVPQAIEHATGKLGLGAAAGGVAYLLPKIAAWTGKNVTKGGTLAVTLGLSGICAWNTVAGAIAGAIWADPPDPNFLEVYTPYNYELPPPTPSASVPEPYVAAFDAALRNQLEVVSVSTAALVSLERYQGAKAAGNQDAATRQLIAYANYTSQAAQAFEREAQLIENLVSVGRASAVPDVVLTPDQVRATQQLLAKNGFTDDILAALAFLGVDEEFLNQRLLPAAMNADPDKAAGNLYDKLLGLAADYRSGGAELSRRSTPTYWVGNPHDKQENVDLFIRPISIPPAWKLSVVNAELAAGQKLPPGDPPEFSVREVEAGKHYSVTLPSKAQVQVASILVPIGELGEHTTARWAVEGKIGNDLIGGMVHVMNVPYTISDLQLTPVATRPSRSLARIVAGVAAGIIILALLVYFFIFWRQRRGTGASAAS